MEHHYKQGARRRKSRKWMALPVLSLIGGFYLLANILSPAAPAVFGPNDSTAKKLASLKPEIDENRIYVPKINIDVPVVQIEGNEAFALEKGAIQRSPASGNPSDGGNFVIAAHRFNLRLTPTQTRAQSPFYHIDKLVVGDDIYVDYKGERFAYKVEERKLVEPTAIEIEERTDDSRLTMYTCELAGSEAGREVVVAKPVGKIVWTDGRPMLKSL